MQLALTYGAAHAGDDLWQRQIVWLRRAVDLLGHKFVAGELDVAPSQLTDALLERERKDVKARWVAVLLLLVPEAMRREWHAIGLDASGYEPEIKLKRQRSAEEALADIERRIAERFGEAGRMLLAEVRR